MSEAAYERLRDAIVRGDLVPGEKIKDAELAEMLGLSRTPVREALTRLVESGLVESKPGVYTRVSTLNHHDIAATLAVLKALDSLAVETAVPRLTERDFRTMRQANRNFAAAVDRQDVSKALAADDAFHHVIIEAAGNPVIARVVEQLHPQVHRILYRKFSGLLGGEETIKHHKELILTCELGDAQAAATLSGEHWSHLSDLISGLFDSNELSD
ncbi:DNA-binding GntR family transcriptional regulator [Arthrobacter pascens]|uniref:GntR family transcriptional regulator n=1 Tax=Arthrobacter pascens TaxID=1677 RepID=UPI00278FD9F5|nr:GntR family transcriptional regulator [Arthrobacter pascens]MDQ0680493.1 DNA-binding GntR family transcriptional regulator [Arthrobacter pascens]